MSEKFLLAIAITLTIIFLQDWSSPIRIRNSSQMEANSNPIAHLEVLP
jgi:hypothetical protein